MTVYSQTVLLELTPVLNCCSDTLLIVRMASCKPSPHRCKILTVSRLLSKEDVDEILYLSEDFIPQSEVKQISGGLSFMRSLERHKRLAPGKYSYLLACLKRLAGSILQKLSPSSYTVVFLNQCRPVLEHPVRCMLLNFTFL